MKKREFDAFQRAALEESGTAIVSAGAGSGKTTVLTERYLRLVRDRGMPIESILALTFTKKATGEMFSRIHASLAAEDSEFVRSQLEIFSKAQISTLDSFCARISRSACVAWGFSPDFSLDDEVLVEMANKEALAFVLEKRESPILRHLIGRHGFERVCFEVFSAAAARMSPSLPLDFSVMPERLEEHIRKLRAEAYERLVEIVDSVYAEGGKETQSHFWSIFNFPLPALESPEFLALCLQIKSTTLPKLTSRFGTEADEIKYKLLPILLGSATALEQLPDYCELYGLLGEFQLKIIAKKRAANILSFHDVAEMARQALLGDHALRDYYKRRYRAIMIDEFQDNNRLQKDLLYLLAEKPGSCALGLPLAAQIEPGKLFFVGDEKQSIYRFRGADVSVFRGLGGELGPEAAQIDLSMNYRSEPRLIDFFNRLFSTIMSDCSQVYDARYKEIGSRAAIPGIEPQILRLICPRLEADENSQDFSTDEETGKNGETSEFVSEIDENAADEDPLSAQDSEAWGIASFIKESSSGGSAPLLVRGEGDKPRPARYSDFAILLRSTGRQVKLELYLRALGIAYRAADLNGFYSEAPANDFYACLRCALYPQDRAVLASYLRSPFANLSDETLVGFLSDKGFSGWEDIDEARLGSLPVTESLKARRALSCLSSVLAMADVQAISRIVDFLWYQAGYRDFILSRPDNHAYLEFFDFFFSLADKADKAGKTLASFIAQLEILMGGGERLRDLSPPREEAEGVHIMTIHKSKGLEFPIVIIPGIENTGNNKDGNGLIHWWMDDVLTVKTTDEEGKGQDFIHLCGKEERDSMEAAELKRLFYVACTRAESHLVFSECQPAKTDKKGSSLRSLLDRALDASDAAAYLEARTLPQRNIGEYKILMGKMRGGRAALSSLLEKVQSARPLDRPALRREFSATELNAAYAQARGYALPDEDAQSDSAADSFSGPAFGTLVHALLQLAVLSGSLDGPLPPAVQALLDQRQDAPAFFQEAQRLAQVFLNSDIYRNLARAQWKAVEYPFVYRESTPEGDCFLRGVIDLIYVLDGECVVVDYKTNLRRVEGEYDLQMSLYRRAAAALRPPARVRSYLFYLRAGGACEASQDVEIASVLEEIRGKMTDNLEVGFLEGGAWPTEG